MKTLLKGKKQVMKKQSGRAGRSRKKDPGLEELLKQCATPEIRPDIRAVQIARLTADIQNMEYLPPPSRIGQILAQMSFISGWIWLAQAGILLLLFLYVFKADPVQLNMMMLCLASGLSLILTCEMSKSFRAGVWEMETACRYNLAQIFFFRLCILFGGDFLVLACALIAYRMADGLLWQFCLFALLPFFLSSAISLCALRRMGNRCHSAAIAVIPLASGNLTAWIFPLMKNGLSCLGITLSGSMPIITLLALLVLLYNAGRLCAKVHYLNENPSAAQS